jgi:DNA replication protein DnaC
MTMPMCGGCYPAVGDPTVYCDPCLRGEITRLDAENATDASFTPAVDAILDAVLPARYRHADPTRLAEQLRHVDPLHAGVLLHGPAGRGKTFQASLLMRRAVEFAIAQGPHRLVDFQWHGAPGLLERMRADMNRKEGRGETRRLVEQLIEARTIVIDDLGAERPTEWVRERLLEIVEERYAAMRPVIVTTNLVPAQIEQRLGARITGRLMEMCEVVMLSGPNLRAPEHAAFVRDGQASLGGVA